MQKTITFGIPCYNSAKDMDRAVSSILDGSDFASDVQIVIVDDGSSDETPAKADAWAARYPDIVEAVHQENGGHGMAVLAGLRAAQGVYYKVLDSDDWVDSHALKEMLSLLRGFISRGLRVDLFISNYVYEHVADDTRTTITYKSVLPRKKVFSWSEIGHFKPWQNLLMHSLCYRTEVLRAAQVPLPAHTFYVDNIYAYQPLPRCTTMYYADIDLYRYFIGREDQSVNEQVMVGRIDQQLRVTRIMMEAYHLDDDVSEPRLRSYMYMYFTMMMAICSVFSRLSDAPDAMDNLKRLWADLRVYDNRMYQRARHGLVGTATNLPGAMGSKTTIGLYHLASRIFKFN